MQAIQLNSLDEFVFNGLLCASGDSANPGEEKTATQKACGADDWALTRRIIGGDDEAFVQLVAKHQSLVTRLVSRFANFAADRDEIVNDTFAEVYFCLPKFRGDSRLSTWVSTIATRLCFRYLKRKENERKRRTLLQRIGWQSEISELRENRDQDSARDQIESLMELLPAEDRMILTLLYWEECSVAEIAKRLNWSEPKIKVRAHRAREKMKQFSERTR